MILGTAGHIDHGKTSLVHALTGVDTDRLPEEKRRGITIDLGFAPLHLQHQGRDITLGVVDVPGHEAFVRTMLAGATGIDLAVLVIAADEGPMPQTREHVAILQLLDVRELIVALTKVDLVEADWLQLVTEDVKQLLQDTRYRDAVVVPTSVVSQRGLDDLRSAIADAATRAHPRAADDLFRMPVDRAFSVKGTGTVVTGTVWSGSLAADETVRLLPSGATARVRGAQSHGAPVARVEPGTRAAIALANVETQVAARGATLVTLRDWEAAVILRADVTMLDTAPELRPRTRVRFHLATADVGARVVAAGSPVAPGTSRTVRIALDEPVVARGGDRFVLRSASPLATIGGGVITDPDAPRRARPMEKLAMSDSERLRVFARERGAHGLTDSAIAVRVGVAPSGAAALAARQKELSRVGDRWFANDVLDELRQRVVALVRAHHDARPLDPGAPREDIRSRLAVDSALFDALIGDLTAAKKIDATGAALRLAGRGGQLTDAQRKTADDLVATLAAAGHEPPSVVELQDRFGPYTPALLKHLEREHRVVQVEDGRYYTPDAVRQLLETLEQGMKGRGELAPTDLREMLGFSRKYLIPFLEYCDRRGYTARQGNGRVWRGTKSTDSSRSQAAQ
ncbi:MAG TPA: selenocysteine-specific translation elongation factor [Gemmatimonadaceae bacterium]|nr:selenocysteine-specific translation elongation factor [Gemmatimonadaceae bacterium]